MAVKKEYKQTDIGAIPRDWELKQLGSIAEVSAGGTPSRGVPEYWNGGIPWVTTTEVDFGRIRVTSQNISALGLKSSAAKLLNPGTILLALYGQGKTRGKVAILDIEATSNQACAAIVLSETVSRPFVFSYLASRYDFIRGLSNTGNQENLNGVIVKSIPIPLPPTLAEQEAIAGALSDADAWIESLEQLIAKKRQIKQGAMQELLTGKRRLPGFSGQWETKRLGDHCRFLRNGTNSRADLSVDGPLKYLHYGDIHSCNNVYMSPKLLPSLPMSKANTLDRLQDGDLVLADASEDTIGISKSVEIVGVDSFELVAGLHTIAVRFSTGLFAPKFVGFLQHCPDFNLHLRKLAAGTKVFATNRRHVSSAEVCVPPLKEQTAIATVLLDMDTEIGSLESKLGKAREIKQGMMQELLTGKIRLV
jgi:type I restriction enzyme S subunit